MRYIIPCILLALTTCLYADDPKSKAIRKYENEVEVLRKQGQAAIKRLEGVFEKEVEKLREKTLKDLQKELDGALEAKDLDKALALREAIKAFEDGDASGLLSVVKSKKESKSGPRKQIPRNAVRFERQRYYFMKGPLTWHQAQAEAERVGGYLLRLNSAAEQDFIITWLQSLNLDSGYDPHIDGTRLLDGKNFRFSNGELMPVNNLKTGNIDGLPNRTWSPFLLLTPPKYVPVQYHMAGECFIIEWDN